MSKQALINELVKKNLQVLSKECALECEECKECEECEDCAGK